MSGTTLGILHQHVVKRLETGADSTSARLDARLVLSYVLEVGPEIIVAYPEREVTDAQSNAVWAITLRRVRGEPMAQILGQKEFWGHTFKVTPDVLIPRPDTETLIDAVLQQFKDPTEPLRILDIGTGTGCILMTLLKEFHHAQGVGTDLSAKALTVAAKNAEALGVSSRLQLIETSYAEGVEGAFDLLVSNPPYIPTADLPTLETMVVNFEPHLALDGGEDGLVAYRRLSADLSKVVLPGGWAFVECGFDQAFHVSDMFAHHGHESLSIHRDLAGIPRIVGVQCKK